MRSTKAVMLMFVLLVGMAISYASANQAPASYPMNAGSEVQIVGGDGCDKALGAAIGFAAGALSPCSIICAIGSFYSIAAMGFMGC